MSELMVNWPALYYPDIHIRNEHWLKATLLFAPTVNAFVPRDTSLRTQSKSGVTRASWAPTAHFCKRWMPILRRQNRRKNGC